MTHKERLNWLAQYAMENGLAVQLKGEVGFGHECVGLLDGQSYVDVDYGMNGVPEYDEFFEKTKHLKFPEFPKAYEIICDPRLKPSPGLIPDAYHKHNCLAILGRGRVAETQLYEWVRPLVDQGAFIEVLDRPIPDNPISVMMHGMTRTRLTFKKYEDQVKELDEFLAGISVST